MSKRNEKLYAYYDERLKDNIGTSFERTQLALKQTCDKFKVTMATLSRLLDKR